MRFAESALRLSRLGSASLLGSACGVSPFVAPLLRSVALASGTLATLGFPPRAQSLRPYGTCLFALLGASATLHLLACFGDFGELKKSPLPSRPPTRFASQTSDVRLVSFAGLGAFASLHLLALLRSLLVATLLRGLLRFARKPALSLVFLACRGASSSLATLGLAGSPLLSTRSGPSLTFQTMFLLCFYYVFWGRSKFGERSDLRSLRSPNLFPCSSYEVPTFS